MLVLGKNLDKLEASVKKCDLLANHTSAWNCLEDKYRFLFGANGCLDFRNKIFLINKELMNEYTKGSIHSGNVAGFYCLINYKDFFICVLSELSFEETVQVAIHEMTHKLYNDFIRSTGSFGFQIHREAKILLEETVAFSVGNLVDYPLSVFPVKSVPGFEGSNLNELLNYYFQVQYYYTNRDAFSKFYYPNQGEKAAYSAAQIIAKHLAEKYKDSPEQLWPNLKEIRNVQSIARLM